MRAIKFHFCYWIIAMMVFVGPLFNSCIDNQSKQINQVPEMWGDLNPGPYTVGFKTIFTYDRAKPPVDFSDWDGRLYTTSETEGRQMQINVWYPARNKDSKGLIQFGHYVDLMGQQTEFGEINEEKRSFANQQFIAKTNALGGNESFTQDKLDILRLMETNAILNASPEKQSFPLIVFPNGGSPAFQSIMCEYFASYGFIVGAMALKGSKTFTDEASVSGIETAVSDLDFGLQKLLEIPQVDSKRIGLIGNAINSSQIIAYQNRNPNIDCVISLEGGLLSNFEQNLLKETAYYEPSAIDVPILAIYAPHPNIDPIYIDHLKYSERYFIHFPQMTEFHFLNYGPFNKFVPDIIGDHQGDVKNGYELACEYSLNFWKAFLSDDSTSKTLLSKIPHPELHEHIDSFFIKRSLKNPPHISVIKDGFIRKGYSFIDSVYQSHLPDNPQPFSKAFFKDLKDWLSWQKDEDYENRYQLYLIARESYPESAEINFYLAYFALETDRKEEAEKYYNFSLRYLESDDDPNLTSMRKQRIKEYIKEDMLRLQAS
ncbi:MAG: hypothetical protein HKN68_01315 [Saprospiraceae bacterium]|nr:hypothetical protein [Saprospiraceae bacterium]